MSVFVKFLLFHVFRNNRKSCKIYRKNSATVNYIFFIAQLSHCGAPVQKANTLPPNSDEKIWSWKKKTKCNASASTLFTACCTSSVRMICIYSFTRFSFRGWPVTLKLRAPKPLRAHAFRPLINIFISSRAFKFSGASFRSAVITAHSNWPCAVIGWVGWGGHNIPVSAVTGLVFRFGAEFIPSWNSRKLS